MLAIDISVKATKPLPGSPF